MRETATPAYVFMTWWLITVRNLWYLALNQEYKLELFENKVLGEMSGPETDVVSLKCRGII
jgi:hypothetical protein